MESNRQPIAINTKKSVYFASDQHFGAPNATESKAREHIFIDWLNQIKPNCGALVLLGDLFDFWIDYQYVVPRGFVRVLGKLAEFTDSGIPIYFFVGNHDLWMTNYLTTELNAHVFFDKQTFMINDKKFLIAHGDGLGPNDKGFKRMKKVFVNPVAQWAFRYLLHPDIAVRFGNYLSRRNRLISGEEDVKFLGEDKEWLVQYCKKKLKQEHFDFLIFGHRHLPLEISIQPKSKYINTGDWISYYSYAVFKDNLLSLEKFKHT